MSGILLTLFVLAAFVGLPLFIWKTIREQRNAVTEVQFKGSTLSALRKDSTVRWTYDVSHPIGAIGVVVESSDIDRSRTRSQVVDPNAGFWRSVIGGYRGRDEVIVAVTFADTSAGGKLLAFSPAGARLWELDYRDVLGPAASRFGTGWTLKKSDIYGVGSNRRTALLFQHASEWPWLLVLMEDDQTSARVTGRFFNAGEISKFKLFGTQARALLVVTGNSASRDAGMMALLDPLSPGGASPEDAGSRFACAQCAEGAPYRYFVFPRSEVNVASKSRINRISGADQAYAKLSSSARSASALSEFNVGTDELWHPDESIDRNDIDESPGAMYVFDLAFDNLLQTSFTGDYWKAHKQLEAKGRLTHSQARCQDRLGPRLVRSWDAARGWRDLAPTRTSG